MPGAVGAGGRAWPGRKDTAGLGRGRAGARARARAIPPTAPTPRSASHRPTACALPPRRCMRFRTGHVVFAGCTVRNRMRSRSRHPSQAAALPHLSTSTPALSPCPTAFGHLGDMTSQIPGALLAEQIVLGRGSRALTRSFHRGEFVRIAARAYLPVESWVGATATERFMATASAMALTAPGRILCGRSALAVGGFGAPVPHRVTFAVELRAAPGRLCRVWRLASRAGGACAPRTTRRRARSPRATTGWGTVRDALPDGGPRPLRGPPSGQGRLGPCLR